MPWPRAVARVADAVLEATVVPSFTKLGAAARERLFDWQDAPAGVLHGRTAVVTGATSGIGLALARRFAELGATVHAVGRDAAKLERTVADLASGTGATVVAQAADLARLEDVRALADRLERDVEHLDVLAHIAGALVDHRQDTVDGMELTAQVHVVAPFLLTARLLDRLVAAGDARVITMSSGGMYTQRLDVDDLFAPPGEFNGTVAYARAKRAQVELNAEWARRYPDAGVGFHAVHPGWVDTPGVQASLPRFAQVIGPGLRTPEQGADTAQWLAWTSEAKAPGGRFWHDRRPRHTVALPWTSTPAGEIDRLWDAVASRAGITP